MGGSAGGGGGSGGTPGVPQLGVHGFDDPVEIGRGGFGVVYRARQPDFDRTVAIKMLAGVLDEGARRRFERERRAMGSLSSHPNIVTVYGSGLTDDGRPYIVMEYVPGGSLADQLRREGAVPWDQAFDIGIKVCDALEEAHRAGVLHRDIKPENILVSKYGEPKLADFGIARLKGGPETASGVVTASLGHSPPEVLDGHRPTPAADVYSLASTLHTLITGGLPFARDTDESVVPMMVRIATEPPPDLRALGVPHPAAAALETAMAKDPAARPASAVELGPLLIQARQAGLGAGEQPSAGDQRTKTLIPPPPPTPPPPDQPPPGAPAAGADGGRKAKVPLLVGGAVLAVVAIAGVVILISGGDDPEDPPPRRRTTTTVVDMVLPAPAASPAWSGEAVLYDLGEQCFDGNLEACDRLYFDSPIDSADEAYGSTCGGRSEEVAGSCLPDGIPPTPGDDPSFDVLAQACFDDDLEACDSLYSDSAIDSAYETYGSTCGGRNEEVDGSCVERYELPGAEAPGDPELDALAEECFDGDLDACDSLYFDSEVDSAYETYGSTCGGRNQEVDGSCVERYEDS